MAASVETEILIEDVARETVWEALIDFEAYPSCMKDVVSARWDERLNSGGKSSWCVLLNGSELSWTEADVFEPYEQVRFQLIEGDVEVWQGHWRIEGEDGALRVTLFVEFDIGIPSLASVLHPIGARAIKANCQQMLAGVRETSLRRSA